MTIPNSKSLIYSNPEGFLYTDFAIINSINKKIELQNIKNIKLSKIRNKKLNTIMLLMALILILVFIIFEYAKNSYYSVAMGLLILVFAIIYKKFDYFFILDEKDGNNFKIKVNINQKENFKKLIYRIKKAK